MMRFTQKDSIVVIPKNRNVARASDRIDIDLRLSKIPVELHPAVNRIASELASNFGWECSDDLDFVKSDDAQTVSFARLALVAMGGLQDFCIDVWGTNLDNLVDEE